MSVISCDLGEAVTELGALIVHRLKALCLSRTQLVGLCGYSNISKGLRRLDEMCAGDLSRSQLLLSRLPSALWVAHHVVDEAVRATEQDKRRQEDQEYRKQFRPHALIICDRSVPEPIWLAALIGIDRILRIDFAPGSSPVNFVDQARKGLADRLRDFNAEKTLPAFGRPIGVVVNYSESRAVTFDLLGNPSRVFDHTIEPGSAFLSRRGRTISVQEIHALFDPPNET